MSMMRVFTAALAVGVLVWSIPSTSAFQPVPKRTRPLSTAVSPPVQVLLQNKLPRAGDLQSSTSLLATKTERPFLKGDGPLAKSVSVVVATVCTYVLGNHLALGPVQASGFVALAAGVLLPERLAVAALCGSFAGMAKVAVVPSVGAATLLGFLCAGMMRLFEKNFWLVGVGGRLGWIAQCACTLQFVAYTYGIKALGVKKIVDRTLGTTGSSAALAEFGLYKMSAAQISAQLPSLVLYTMAGAFFMRAWKRYSAKVSEKLSNLVAAVGATGIVGSLFLPAAVAGSAYAGAFVGMSSANSLPSTFSLAMAAALAGAWQLGLTGVLLGGWGGKLGTSALLGVLSYKSMRKPLKKTARAVKSLLAKQTEAVVEVQSYNGEKKNVDEKAAEAPPALPKKINGLGKFDHVENFL